MHKGNKIRESILILHSQPPGLGEQVVCTGTEILDETDRQMLVFNRQEPFWGVGNMKSLAAEELQGLVAGEFYLRESITTEGLTECQIDFTYGASLSKGGKTIISIAHPDHREELDRAAFERFGPHYMLVK